MKKQMIMIAAFRSETCESQLLIGEGFTFVEAIVRAIEYELNDQQVYQVVQQYGPDDIEGLYEWYLSRGIFLSEALVLSDRSPLTLREK